MARGRHVPHRMCVGCRTIGDKRGLMRIARSPDGRVHLDPTGKAPGRGVYVCFSEECITTAARKKVFDRHLRVAVPTDIYDQLLQEAARRPATSPAATSAQP